MQTTPCLHTSLYTGLHTGLRLAGLVGLLALHSFAATAESPSWQQLSFGGDFSDVASATGFFGNGAYQISSDSQWVVFRHNPDFEDVHQLYSTPLDGSTVPTRISGLLGPLALRHFAITLDATHVVYIAKQDDPDLFELFRVPIAGGPATQLNHALDPGFGVESFEISPDGSHVVYLAEGSLYAVPTAGGTPTLLATPAPGSFIGGPYRFTPAGARIVYMVEDETAHVRVFSVPVAGGTIQDLGEVVDGFLGLTLAEYQLSSDGQFVVYIWISPSDNHRIYAVPTAGGTRVDLAGGLNGFVTDFVISPDGSQVIHVAEGHQAPQVWGLYTTPLGGGAVDLFLDVGPDASSPTQLEWSPDGSSLVFIDDSDTAGVFEIFSIPSAGGTPTQLNPALPNGADVTDFRISADSRWVVYLADQLLQGVPTLWRTPLEGPASANEPVFFGSPSAPSPNTWDVDARSDRVIVLSNLFFNDGVRRPWRRFFAGPQDELVDETEFVTDGAVREFRFAPNGDIVYRADQNVDEKFELFSVTFPLDEIFGDGFESGDTSAW